MKLLICLKCNDIFNLKRFLTQCRCGETSGYYIDHKEAMYDGDNAVPIGFDNNSLVMGIKKWLENKDEGVEFTAFIMPQEHENLKRIK